ncbi:MAG TPA: DUF3313 domain-containing protein [Syntrophorhabdaceae bacterium]|jgi:hypothetical protein|nr:DUF3313 domain-containing protein [Syntrophorhabdaceae bacterium]
MKKLIIFVVFLSMIAVGTVYGSGLKKYSDIESSSQMQPKQDTPDTLIYKREGVDGKKFVRFIIEPVVIYQGDDADFGSVSKKEIRTVADFMKSEFERVLQGKYQIVDVPGTGVLRIKLTLAGIELTRPALAVATRIIPFGLALNLGKSAVGMNGSFTGSVTCAGEFYDAETNILVYSFLTRRSPNAMDVTAVLTGLDASKKAITEIAEKFIEMVDKLQGVVKK